MSEALLLFLLPRRIVANHPLLLLSHSLFIVHLLYPLPPCYSYIPCFVLFPPTPNSILYMFKCCQSFRNSKLTKLIQISHVCPISLQKQKLSKIKKKSNGLSTRRLVYLRTERGTFRVDEVCRSVPLAAADSDHDGTEDPPRGRVVPALRPLIAGQR